MRLHRPLKTFLAAGVLLAGLHSPTMVEASLPPACYCDLSTSKLTASPSTAGTVKVGSTLQLVCTVSLGANFSIPTSQSSCDIVLKVNGVKTQTLQFDPRSMSPRSSKNFTFSAAVTQPVGSVVTYSCEVNPQLQYGVHAVTEEDFTNNTTSISYTIVQ